MGYRQSNADHTLFFTHNYDKITILVVYVDDIVITGDDDKEILCLKRALAKSFEVKDLGYLHYFLGIEVAYGAQGIYLSQRKYVLDLLKETSMLNCKPVTTPIEYNHRILADSGDPVDKHQYQRNCQILYQGILFCGNSNFLRLELPMQILDFMLYKQKFYFLPAVATTFYQAEMKQIVFSRH